MLIIENQNRLKSVLNEPKNLNKRIGFVPTMGALHEGHLSLIKHALNDNQLVVISIFVNPTQFNNTEDLEKYPRNISADIALVKKLSNEIIFYTPSVEDIYKSNVIAKEYNFSGLENEMEGANRPGHFNGVGTIVHTLFKIVKPKNAYFGEKDFQQLLIIKKLVHQEGLDINIISCPILRNANGLAMSSRNERLTNDLKQEAGLIFQTLQEIKSRFHNTPIENLTNYVKSIFKTAPNFKLEYFVIASETTLKAVKNKKENEKYRAFIVVHIGGVRLIDNLQLN